MRKLTEWPKRTQEERAYLIADHRMRAEYWEEKAKTLPADEEFYCLDYAKHLRTIIELEQLASLDDVD